MPLPVKNFLTAEQVKKLQDALRENPLPHVRERVLIILLQNDGKTQIDISQKEMVSLSLLNYKGILPQKT